MISSQEIKQITAALVEIQKEIGMPDKSGRNKFYQGHNYSKLIDVIKVIQMVAPKHGVAFSSNVETRENQKYCVTTIMHISGEYLSDEVPLVISNNQVDNNKGMQVLGSAITYARRYSLQNLFGLVGDDDSDDDGNSTTSHIYQQKFQRGNQKTTQETANVMQVGENKKFTETIKNRLSILTKDMDTKGKLDFMSQHLDGIKKFDDINGWSQQKLSGYLERLDDMVADRG